MMIATLSLSLYECLLQDLAGGTLMPVEGVDLPLYAMEVCLHTLRAC
jgi:hypothetical protein